MKRRQFHPTPFNKYYTSPEKVLSSVPQCRIRSSRDHLENPNNLIQNLFKKSWKLILKLLGNNKDLRSLYLSNIENVPCFDGEIGSTGTATLNIFLGWDRLVHSLSW